MNNDQNKRQEIINMSGMTVVVSLFNVHEVKGVCFVLKVTLIKIVKYTRLLYGGDVG